MSADQPLRIGLIAPPWVAVPPHGYGGTESVIDQLARALVAKGHEVTLFATADSSSPVPIRSVIDSAPGVHVGGPVVEMRQVLSAYEAFEGYDIVHDHTTIGPLYARHACAGPIVATNHNPFAEPFLSIFREIDGRIPIIAISHHHAAEASTLRNISVIHHGIDPEDYQFEEQPGDYLLFLGRMSPDKGVVEAMSIARSAGIPLLMGAKMSSGKEISYFHDAVEPLLGEDCRYLGEVDQAEKRALLSGARCLLNPITWDEPFGMVMLESLASGTPVIARRRGSTPEIIEDGVTGFLGDSDEDLTHAVSRIGEIDRDRCRNEVTKRFSAAVMADAHLALYQREIERSGGQRVHLKD